MTDQDQVGLPTEGYEPVAKLLVAGGYVMLDGPVEAASRRRGHAAAHQALPYADLVAAHHAHVEAGCDVIRTCTAALPPAVGGWFTTGPPRWMDQARERIDAARDATAGTSTAVAYSLGRHIDGPDAEELVPVLARLFRKAPPDLVLVETLSVIRPSLYAAVSGLLSLGLPVWLSFRRCRDGLCGPSGHHWSADEPDRFGGAASRLERMGVSALLVNCVPAQHVQGTFEYLRYFTDLPLGVYANLEPGFGPETLVAGHPQADYEMLAERWRAEGAQIIGGCCGVGPDLLGAVRETLAYGARADAADERLPRQAAGEPAVTPRPWVSARGRRLFPLPFPRLARTDGVPSPTVCDLLVWEYLYREGGGANQRCLDVGSGSGLLAVQLALNGATHVHSIDSAPEAVRCTLDSAFRNDVSSSVTAETADMTTWRPRERYEVVVASIEQPGTDPWQQDPQEREFDPWGRRLIDAFITKLPELLAREGVAYLAHSSAVSQQRTAELLAAAGLAAEVVDWRLWPASAQPTDRPHRMRIEQLSDAFHLDTGTQDVRDELMVVYLIEIRRSSTGARPAAVQVPERAP
jgi:hypothetical protein